MPVHTAFPPLETRLCTSSLEDLLADLIAILMLAREFFIRDFMHHREPKVTACSSNEGGNFTDGKNWISVGKEYRIMARCVLLTVSFYFGAY